MASIAVIPARGGSKRIPRKNIREFHGKPIIAYSIEAALESGLFEKVIVSTDDNEIANIARNYGASTPFLRPDFLSDDKTGTQMVARHALENEKYMRGWEPEYACCIYATAPLMSVADLMSGYEMIEMSGVDHAISVGYPPLSDAAQFYWSTSQALLDNIEYFGYRTRLVKIDTQRVCDINLLSDWARAEIMYGRLP